MICLYLKTPKKIVRFIFLDGFWVIHIPFFSMVKFKLFAQLPVDHLAHSDVLSLILSLWFLRHSLIKWLIILSPSPHNQHLLFCCVLSIFALTYLVLMALLWADNKRDPVSLLRFPFLCHVQVFSCEISLVCRLMCPYSSFLFPIFVFWSFLFCWCLFSLLFLAAVSVFFRAFYVVF